MLCFALILAGEKRNKIKVYFALLSFFKQHGNPDYWKKRPVILLLFLDYASSLRSLKNRTRISLLLLVFSHKNTLWICFLTLCFFLPFGTKKIIGPFFEMRIQGGQHQIQNRRVFFAVRSQHYQNMFWLVFRWQVVHQNVT